MKKTILITLLLVSANTIVYAQSSFIRCPKQPLRLSKQQMYDDYDQFVDIIKTYNAQWEIRSKYTGYDLMAILQNRRTMIDSIDNYWEFINFLDNSLLFLLDNHANRTSFYYKVKEPRYAPGQSFYKSKKISKVYDGLDKYLAFKYSTDTVSPIFQTIACKYIDGEYYMLASFAFVNRSVGDSICFKNARVIACDNMPVDNYVKEKMIGLLSPYHIRFDFNKNKYYTDQLVIDYNKSLKVEDENGIIHNFVPNNYPIKIQSPANDYLSKHLSESNQNYNNRELHFAKYFEKEKILYIYLEMMSYQKEHNIIDTVKKIGKGGDIDKIIIDVRGNIGGGDKFWDDLLSAIIKDTIKFYDKIALNANEQTIAFFKSQYPKEMVDEFEYLKVPFLDDKTMFVHTKHSTIDPDEESLCFSGPIYIFQNERTFSSGHSFSSFAKHSDQLISVGVPTGDMVGFGFNPWHFQLKNSLFTFHFETTIDLSNSNKWEDTFQCVPEIVVWPSIEELLNYNSYRYLMDIEEFLFTKDYLFQKVLKCE